MCRFDQKISFIESRFGIRVATQNPSPLTEMMFAHVNNGPDTRVAEPRGNLLWPGRIWSCPFTERGEGGFH